MTDATSRPGADGARGAGKIGRGTGNDPAGSHSPLVTPTETEAPDLDRAAGTPRGERRDPETGGEGGFAGDPDPAVGGDKGSGLGAARRDEGSGLGAARRDESSGLGAAGRDKTSGLGAAERDKTSGLGRENGRGGDAGSDGVGGVGPGVGGSHGREARLLPHEESDKLSMRLQHAVAGFVDEPRSAVEEADHVLEEVAARFADAVKQRRHTLRNSWQGGDGGQDKAVAAGDTEQLRLALRDYRELTERLLHS
ncbi:hypothetical protein IOD14_35240 [Streptomyces sp. A2-16]|uniref:hypothetical protein n=1 Tax=Streptomyces sp. A2-16 TaxID=2781734 RepID=UPI001BB010E2|nr:hypothetical protein [Streptomyces sp. A2-16]QUC61619.1 hypothetical protein IOD14_35240 [Streptomyces sp. A2-16]